MATEKIRLYGNMTGYEGTVVSFSEGLSTTPQKASEELHHVFDQSMTVIESPQELQHMSAIYYEILPPLQEEQIRRFARICIKHADDGRKVVEFIDNRETIPERVLQIAGPVIEWVG